MFYSFLVMNFRNKFLLIMNLILPIIFMLMFGAVFGKQSGAYKVAYYSDRDINIESGNWVKIDKPSDVESIKALKFDIVILAEKGKIDVYYLSSMAQSERDVLLFRTKYSSAQNQSSVIEIKAHNLELERQLSDLEYIMIGVIAVSLLSVGLNAGVSIFSKYVRYGLFKRFMVTKVKPAHLLFSSVGAQLITGIISSFIILILSRLVFGVNLFVKLHDIPLYIAVVFASVMINLSIGVLLSLFFKKAAESISSLIYTIFIFFSGVYFPITIIPKSLRIISYFTPPRYVHMMFQKLYGVNSMDNVLFFVLIIGFSFFGLLLGSYAIKKFLKPTA